MKKALYFLIVLFTVFFMTGCSSGVLKSKLKKEANNLTESDSNDRKTREKRIRNNLYSSEYKAIRDYTNEIYYYIKTGQTKKIKALFSPHAWNDAAGQKLSEMALTFKGKEISRLKYDSKGRVSSGKIRIGREKNESTEDFYVIAGKDDPNDRGDCWHISYSLIWQNELKGEENNYGISSMSFTSAELEAYNNEDYKRWDDIDYSESEADVIRIFNAEKKDGRKIIFTGDDMIYSEENSYILTDDDLKEILGDDYFDDEKFTSDHPDHLAFNYTLGNVYSPNYYYKMSDGRYLQIEINDWGKKYVYITDPETGKSALMKEERGSDDFERTMR